MKILIDDDNIITYNNLLDILKNKEKDDFFNVREYLRNYYKKIFNLSIKLHHIWCNSYTKYDVLRLILNIESYIIQQALIGENLRSMFNEYSNYSYLLTLIKELNKNDIKNFIEIFKSLRYKLSIENRLTIYEMLLFLIRDRSTDFVSNTTVKNINRFGEIICYIDDIFKLILTDKKIYIVFDRSSYEKRTFFEQVLIHDIKSALNVYDYHMKSNHNKKIYDLYLKLFKIKYYKKCLLNDNL